MGSSRIKERSEIDNKYKWDIEDMFPDESVIEDILAQVEKDASDFTAYKGRLGSSAETLLEALTARDHIWQTLEKVMVYARMRRDEDNRAAVYQAMTDRCGSIAAKVAAVTSFFTPELLEASEDEIMKYVDSLEGLEIYRFYLSDVFRLKKHVLSKEEENIVAQLSEVTGATGDIFTMLNNADLTFGEIKDEKGNEVTLTHGNYIKFMESKERSVRKDAFSHMYRPYMDLINTVATTYNYNTKTDVVSARMRNYGSSLEAALASDNIPLSVYDNLIDIVNETLPFLYKYLDARKKLLGVDELHMYDIYVPLIDIPREDIPYEKGLDIIREALKPMGSDYLEKMNSGLASGWVDVYENAGKTSGAYSFGSYDSKPYMLLNYANTLQDVFTIIHEMGHSMHSCYTRAHQPYIYGSHSIFTAEVASTVNESLLMHHLISNAEDEDKRKYLINMHIEEFRTTLFRQTMFAEFEKLTHEAAESGTVLTAEWLCDQYRMLNEKYFGSGVVSDEEIAYEWARIPHFYNAFYVYKYATGYSAATAISGKIISEGEKARDNYIEFLKTGESDHPIELLKIAGVDMSSPEPVKQAMNTFKNLVDEFTKLV